MLEFFNFLGVGKKFLLVFGGEFGKPELEVLGIFSFLEPFNFDEEFFDFEVELDFILFYFVFFLQQFRIFLYVFNHSFRLFLVLIDVIV